MKKDSLQDLTPLFHPKFIGYWLMVAILWLLVQLPWRLRMGIGAQLGRLALVFAKSRQRISKINLQKVFPQLNKKEQQTLLRRYADSLGQGLIETGMAWFWSDKRLKQITRLEGDTDAIAKIKNPSQPVVLVGSHSTLMELGLRILGLYIDAAGMYRPLTNPFFEVWIKHHRRKSATDMVHFRDMRHVLKVLKSGGNIWYALDQDVGEKVSVFAPFFGIEACSVNILPRLTERTDAVWIPVFVWREGRGYVAYVLPEITQVEGQTDIEVATRVNALIEAEIRKHPEQYFWVHRRFKNRPGGEEKWY